MTILNTLLNWILILALFVGLPGLLGGALLGTIMYWLSNLSWKFVVGFYLAQLAGLGFLVWLLARSVGQGMDDGTLDGPTGFGAGIFAGAAMFVYVGTELFTTFLLFRILKSLKPSHRNGQVTERSVQ